MLFFFRPPLLRCSLLLRCSFFVRLCYGVLFSSAFVTVFFFRPPLLRKLLFIFPTLLRCNFVVVVVVVVVVRLC